MSYTIEDIARIIGARRIGDRPAAIDWLLTDSRSLSFPEETLFFALPTKRHYRQQRKNHCEGVAASVAESRTDDNTLSPQLQFPDRRTFVRVADE